MAARKGKKPKKVKSLTAKRLGPDKARNVRGGQGNTKLGSGGGGGGKGL